MRLRRRISIESVARLDVRPGDRIVLRVGSATDEQAAQAREAWAKFAPDVPIIILAGEVDVTVLPAEDAQRQEPLIRGDRSYGGHA